MPHEPSTEPSLQFPFAVAVDLVVLGVHKSTLRTLVVHRGDTPHQGRWSLPGGLVGAEEDLEAAAARELGEKTGLSSRQQGSGPAAHLEQLATYGAPGRDQRARVVSVAYLVVVPWLESPTPDGGHGYLHGAPLDLATSAGGGTVSRWVPVDVLLPHPAGSSGATSPVLAFDHDRILLDGVERARSKIEYSSLATAFCPPEFTVGELRRVYEAVWGVVLDPRNFHRKVTGTPGFLVPTGGTTSRQGGRPAQLFRAGGATLLNPPMLRPEA